MNAPVSVIIPCYNSEATLERAVDSVCQQTRRPSEVILVDNASSDGTRVAARRLQSKYGADWLKLIESPVNAGPSGGRNLGWNAARERYIAFLDSDDSWHSQKIELQLGYMEAHPEKVATGHGFEVLSESIESRTYSTDFAVLTRSFRDLLFKNYFVTPSIMLKREISERFLEGRNYMEDHLLWLEIAYRHGAIDRIELPLAFLYKPQIGASGLSARLWSMEKGELHNYLRLVTTGRIGPPAAARLMVYSLAKFVRRVLRVKIQKAFS